MQDLQRLLIEIGREIRRVGTWLGEQLGVDADFRTLRLCRGEPMHGRLDLAPIGRVAALGRGIIGAAQFHHLAGRILDGFPALDEIGVAKPHLGARRQAEEFLRRILHEIVLLDIELAAEGYAARAG